MTMTVETLCEREAIATDRCLSILRVMHQAPRDSSNPFMLRDALNQIYGHTASLEQVGTDISRLAASGFVTSHGASGATVATLTERARQCLKKYTGVLRTPV